MSTVAERPAPKSKRCLVLDMVIGQKLSKVGKAAKTPPAKGKIDTTFTSANPAEIEQAVLQHEDMQRFFEGKQPKKVIIVPNKIVNVVI